LQAEEVGCFSVQYEPVLNSCIDGFPPSINAKPQWIAKLPSLAPNNDDDFADMADVINLSLGGFGCPNDPMSLTIDNAIGGCLCLVFF